MDKIYIEVNASANAIITYEKSILDIIQNVRNELQTTNATNLQQKAQALSVLVSIEC
jgi:outer membrane protein TolC